MPNRTLRLAATSACLWLVAATVAHAQAPRGGLFGGSRSASDGGQAFNVTVALSEAYDTEVPGEFRHRLPQAGPQSGGFSTMLTSALDYSHTSRLVRISGSGQSAFRYYQQLSDVAPVSHSGALGARLNISRRTTLELNQTVAYSPTYMFQLFPGVRPPDVGEAVASAPEFRAARQDSYSYGSVMNVAVGSPRGHRFAVGADYRHTDYREQVVSRQDLTTYGARASYGKGIGRNAGWSAEYEFRTGEFQLGSAEEHQVKFGINHSRPLSASRRMTMRLMISPAIIQFGESADALVSDRVQRLQAEASVEYQFHRLWQAGASFRRATEFVPAFVEPVFADSASVQLTGLLTRRIDLTMAAGLSKGGSVLSGGDNHFDTYTGSSRLRLALTRNLALYTEYLYYFYDLGGQTSLAPDLPETFEQQGARAGVMWLIPLF